MNPENSHAVISNDNCSNSAATTTCIYNNVGITIVNDMMAGTVTYTHHIYKYVMISSKSCTVANPTAFSITM